MTEAVHALAGRPGPLASDLRRMSARLRLGAPLVDALGAWADERPVAGVRAAAGALTLVTTVGGSAAGPLEGLAASLRADDAAAGEARALSAQARVSAAVVGLAPLALPRVLDDGGSGVVAGARRHDAGADLPRASGSRSRPWPRCGCARWCGRT